ncbi:MAG: 3-isopropylmalate dehydratase small subunit [Tepidanaerobacteraceae bacterium]|nr:3-isopropylmalate dehydratase small subunit [Tepidanaerobacteraceae bacterium]
MNHKLMGKVFLLGDNIDTDQIYPGRYIELTSKSDIAAHCMEGVRPGFSSQVCKGDIIVAGENFGCGSSREHAVITLKEAGVGLVIAKSFARIFFRNAINLGLPVITCKSVYERVRESDVLEANLLTGEIKSLRRSEVFKGEPLPEFVMEILNNGGIKNMFKEKYGQI